MKAILAVLISALLSVQTVYAMPAGEPVLYTEDTASKESGEEIKEEPQGGEMNAVASGTEISAPSGILMEASTGEILFDKNADEKMPPASVTKIMTLLIIFDAVEAGKLKLEDEITVSEYAASMGGSQVFLEPGEVQTAETMIKCIAVASANDACVAMAEHIWGSEEEFVAQMNQRAKDLGMTNTNFQNCNGLDADQHLTTAHDIALMSRELITKYPQIHEYSTIWMETITHTTKKGTTEFGLTNTNKLIRQYEYATGLKTGSTSKAKYCVSATAKKNDIELIAVIMAAPDYKVRFQDAAMLLNYGFGKCQIYKDETMEKLKPMEVKAGVKESLGCKYKDTFTYLSMTGEDLSKVTKELVYQKELKAPIKKGQKVGELIYKLGDKKIGSIDILASEQIEKAKLKDYFMKMAGEYLL